MNKKLLIAAVGAALVAGPMLAAHAAPTVYGKFNVGIAAVDNGNSADGDTLGVTDDSSRLGVKGSEDLGGGLKAIYQMEMRYDADGNQGSAFTGNSRDVFLGLQGSWGSVKVGQYQSYYKAIQFPLEIMGDTIGDWSTNGWSGEGRIANAIGYMSPNWSGFAFGIETSRGETGTATESNPTTIGATFKSGPLYLGIGHEDKDLQATSGSDSSTKFVAMYDIDALKLIAAFQSQKSKGGAAELDTTVVGAEYAFGNNSVLATFAQHDSTTANADCDQTTLGFEHRMSKTTLVRAIYSSIDNESAVSCRGRMVGTDSPGGVFGGGTGPSLELANPTAGSDPSGFQVQMVLSF